MDNDNYISTNVNTGVNIKGHQVLFVVFSKVVLFMSRNIFVKIFFLRLPFFLVLTFRTYF